MNKIALVADIEKAFLNVEVCKKDRDCLRFLWVGDVNCETVKPSVYRFCRVVFGVNCSPFLLNATLQYHLETFRQDDPKFVEKMKGSFYVDDLASGENNEKKALEMYRKAKTRLAAGGFRLHKWMSNSQEVMNNINEKELSSEKETYAGETLGVNVSTNLEKVLGIPWNLQDDRFYLVFKDLAERASDLVPTKRNVLSILAGLYDPLGIVSPVGVSMKILFQMLCIEGLGWDEELAGRNRELWIEWTKDLHETKQIAVSRYVLDPIGDNLLKCTLHGFADASNKAYCAVLYLVCQAGTRTHVQLLTSKTRVAPLKPHSIPRMELMAARVLAKLLETVSSALRTEIEITETYLWSDSKTVLYWIANKGEWKQFVRHRVNEILKLTKKENWGHCPGEENPADIGSRGVLASMLRDSELWWKGPDWLMKQSSEWPNNQKLEESEEVKEERKKVVVMSTTTENVPSIENIMDLNRYSKLDRVLRVTAWIVRFVNNLKLKRQKKELKLGNLNREEIFFAEKLWVKAVQLEFRKGKVLDSLKHEFNLVESEGIFRCNGRLKFSELDVSAQQPMLLSKSHRFTKLVIIGCREKVHHSGLRMTLAELRTRFWVPRGRQVVKKVLSECVVCIKLQGKAFKAQPTPDLPDFRVKQHPPFSRVGVDFAGPLYAKFRNSEDMEKVYLVLFTCCVTRAVHLELLENQSAATFVRCLRRFSARRGVPVKIISDNAKTFKYTSSYLKRLCDSPEVKKCLEEKKIDWEFNLEKAPWWGGFFERLIGTVKRCLRKVLGKAKLSFDGLNTVLVEVECTVNSRPLTYVYDELDSETLTPMHLIYGRKITSMPDEVKDEEDVSESGLIRRYRYLARLRKHFWNRWQKEYLADLREFHKWNGKQERSDRAQIGDIVLVQEDGVKRGLWRLGSIEELIVGKDGCVRGCRLRVISKGKPVHLNRPLQKLFPLELSICNQEEEPELRQNVEISQDNLKADVIKDNLRRSARIANKRAIDNN